VLLRGLDDYIGYLVLRSRRCKSTLIHSKVVIPDPLLDLVSPKSKDLTLGSRGAADDLEEDAGSD
jgi:hypothetical protein